MFWNLHNITYSIEVIIQLIDFLPYSGATITHNWSPDCTHVLVDDFMPVKEHAVDAIVAKKPLILQNWVEVHGHLLSSKYV